MSINVNGRTVPIVWKPSDLSGPDSDGHVGREEPIRAIVHHRVVGTLESMSNVTFKPTTDNVLRSGERRVSSHFGIGFNGTRLEIHQYVALDNTAYCNGQTDADVRALLTTRPWRIYSEVRNRKKRHVSANEFTVSIEHEDNGSSGRYIVKPEIIEASIALDKLLLSGDARRIRAAGIRCSDIAATQLGRIQPTKDTIVDHNRCAPVSKPYCWRPIGGDKGFPQDRYLAALGGAEEEVLIYKAYETPGYARIAAGARVNGYSISGGTLRHVKTWENHGASSIRFTEVLHGTQSPTPLLKVVGSEFFEGLYVPTSQVEEVLDPVVAPDVQKAVAEAVAPLEEEIANLHDAIATAVTALKLE